MRVASAFAVVFVALLSGLARFSSSKLICSSILCSLYRFKKVKHLQACQHGCFSAAKQKSWSTVGLRLVRVNCSQGTVFK
jgi:hypothetical protein